MKNIERFIRDNRESFDNLEPSSQIWEKIEAQIGPAKQKTRIIKMRWIKWSVAASLVIALSATAVYLFNASPKPETGQVAVTRENKSSITEDPVVENIDPAYGKMVAQFTSLIEAKQNEIKSIEKDDPELYRQFSSDIKKLDSAYQVLRSTLPANPNKEQLLQAMIQNLQLQIDVLNQQLQIIQKVKQPKSKQI